jgi:hypothetical protein
MTLLLLPTLDNDGIGILFTLPAYKAALKQYGIEIEAIRVGNYKGMADLFTRSKVPQPIIDNYTVGL